MLLQAPFNVWVENKKDLLKGLKPLRRHIFLFRKAMIFCKKTSSHSKGEYQFKGMLKVSTEDASSGTYPTRIASFLIVATPLSTRRCQR